MKAPLSSKRSCSNPPVKGNIGEFLIQGCRRKTCRRKGRKAIWVETIESKKCCNYDQQWYEMGETIKEIQSTDNCTSATISCANNKGSSEIRIKTKNQCSQHLETEMRKHANISDRNYEKLEEKMETLLQIFLNKTVTCCDSVTLSTTHADWTGEWAKHFGGTYNLYEAQPMLNGRAVYEKNDWCLFWECDRWMINKCSAMDSGACSWYVGSSFTSEQCVHGYDGSWSWKSNDDPAMAATCSAGGCPDGWLMYEGKCYAG